MLVRQGDVFWVRRRVPRALKGIIGKSEIWRSTGATSRRVAVARAASIYSHIELEFTRARAMLTYEEFVKDFPDDLKAQCSPEFSWEENLRIFEAYVDRLELTMQLKEARAREYQLMHVAMQMAFEHIQEQEETKQNMARAQEHAANLFESIDRVIPELGQLRAGKAEVNLKRQEADRAREEADRRLHSTAEISLRLESMFKEVQANARSHEQPPSPVFSAELPAFLEEKARIVDGRPQWTIETRLQSEKTYALWIEFLGDRPVRSYTAAEAGQFRKMLLSLPTTHGKLGQPPTIKEAIEKADKTNAKRISHKTAKRHFSAMTQYWRYLDANGYVESIIFSKFEFVTSKNKTRKIFDYSDVQLRSLFTSLWFKEPEYRTKAEYWVPLIALFSAMRLEEICRLRPVDIQELSGISCFVLQPHPDGWSPKTQAGERPVPVHPFLIELGFLDLLAKRRKAGSARLFPELKPGGRGGRLGHEFSKKFGRLKKNNLKFPDSVNFHSFRHTFRTAVASALVEDEFIDRVVGHAAGEDGSPLPKRWLDACLGEVDPRSSEGQKTYTKRTKVERLAEVVRAFEPPCGLDFLRSELGR
jgi:integrase